MVTERTDRRHSIRRIFLSPRESYSLLDASKLLGMTPTALRYAVEEAKQYDCERVRGTIRFTWAQLAHIAIDKWTLRTIEAELGEDVGRALPPLLILRELRVFLPGYQVEMLHRLAAMVGTDVNTYLSDHLLDLAESDGAHVAMEIPGFDRALRFPDDE